VLDGLGLVPNQAKIARQLGGKPPAIQGSRWVIIVHHMQEGWEKHCSYAGGSANTIHLQTSRRLLRDTNS
jgi:hypothetical protein